MDSSADWLIAGRKLQNTCLEEITQIVAIAAQGRRREVVTRQAGEERRHPARFAGDRLGRLYARRVIPALAPLFAACNTASQ